VTDGRTGDSALYVSIIALKM